MKILDKVLTMRMGTAHSLILGHLEPNSDKDITTIQPKDESLNFGLFGGESQYNQFNPATKPEDWTPGEEDFIYPVFRLLSETMVYKWGVPIDFTGGVLKSSSSMLVGQTVFPDHKNTEVGNALGAILKTEWQESYTHQGVKVPSGINGVLKLDAKSNPRIARALLMDPPAIHSGSVQVNFSWVKSHDLTDPEFFEKVGTYHKDGSLIRLVVDKIKAYGEYSLVPHGADPFAQKVEDGKIHNPKYAAKSLSPSFNLVYTEDQVIMDFKQDINSNLNNNNMNALLLLASAILGDHGFTEESTESEISQALEARFSEANQAAVDLQSRHDILAGSVSDLTSQLETANTSLTELQDSVKALGGIEKVTSELALATTLIFEKRGKVVGKYKALNGDDASPAILSLIESADLATLNAFDKEYSTALEVKVPLTCQSCGSEDVSRASFKREDSSKKAASFNDEARAIQKSKVRKPSDLHKK